MQNALNEARMLILGSQVLLGFQFRSVFESGFEKLPHYAQYLKLSGLALMVIAVGLLMSPGAYHRIVEEGEDTNSMHRFTTRIMDVALLPFALGLGIDIFVATDKIVGTATGIFAGLFSCLFALFFWYGLEAMRRNERKPAIEEKMAMDSQKKASESEGTKLKDKIKHVLTEARVVLPGAQALLGFQFATILMEGYPSVQPCTGRRQHRVPDGSCGISSHRRARPGQRALPPLLRPHADFGNGAARPRHQRRLLRSGSQGYRVYSICCGFRRSDHTFLLWIVVRRDALQQGQARKARPGCEAARA
jgi:hypothetical protein